MDAVTVAVGLGWPQNGASEIRGLGWPIDDVSIAGSGSNDGS
jgi:hypothetical protein